MQKYKNRPRPDGKKQSLGCNRMETAEEFILTGKRFQLGMLETEMPHSKTRELSNLAQRNIPKALDLLASVDIEALEKLKSKTANMLKMRSDIKNTWQSGGRVFLCGCGATGRLSLTLETLYEEQSPRGEHGEKVIAFMAGGDVALVHSLEGFEDFSEYGSRHLKELGFGRNDLLISSTEGGETPFVIGATEAAADVSKRKPCFLYCNPDDVLTKNVERSRKIIENSGIEKINLSVGPMALAGSTRMQASTVLQLVIGFALLTNFTEEEIKVQISLLQEYLNKYAATFLTEFTKIEADEYWASRYIMYNVKDYSMTVFTDTTERAPTFSLTPFSHKNAARLLKMKPSSAYIMIQDTITSEEAWMGLLKRKPRPLNWDQIDMRTSSDYLFNFDFSKSAADFRSWLTNGSEHTEFKIFRKQNFLCWHLKDIEKTIRWPDKSYLLFEHTFLKMLLNMHSTVVMGRLGRYEGNLMTWVYPTNGKLIDRATRYVKTLLSEDGIERSYDDVVREIFKLKKILPGNESIVIAAYKSLKS